jgi:pimeloyl-ACP methyl ester carboxylesterase
MPILHINNADLHYTDTGGEGEVIFFSHGLLWSGYMFYKQEAYFKDKYRIITHDHRGQGQSQATESGYDMDSLTADALALIKALCPNQQVHFAGLSMGGFVAMRLAARYPTVLRSVILMETSADPEPLENVPKYTTLNKVVKWLGTWAVVGKVMPIMFSQKFLNDPSRKTERKQWEARMKLCKAPGITKAVAGVIERKPIFDELKNITLPTLIMVGTQDVATVPAKAERIHANIANSMLVYIEGGGHTSSIEEPQQVNNAIEVFLQNLA